MGFGAKGSVSLVIHKQCITCFKLKAIDFKRTKTPSTYGIPIVCSMIY